MVDKDLFLHDLSIAAILKNEGHYLKEWLDYHLLAGVDHFYLYDNDSPDNQAEVAKPYVEAGLVDYIPFPGDGVSTQLRFYNDAIKRFRFQNRYLAFIDCDEFIYPKLTGGGVSLMSSTKFSRKTPKQWVWQFIGKFLGRMDKKKQIIQRVCLKDLRVALRKILREKISQKICTWRTTVT